MPYLLLALGCLIGLFALYRFFLNADIKQIKALFLSVVLVILVGALLFLAITGRLPAALALLVPIAPVARGIIKELRESDKSETHREPHGASNVINSRKEALEILGLDENADTEEIKRAYKKLMGKVHPDAEGSEWMAAKLNAAKDYLLKGK